MRFSTTPSLALRPVRSRRHEVGLGPGGFDFRRDFSHMEDIDLGYPAVSSVVALVAPLVTSSVVVTRRRRSRNPDAAQRGDDLRFDLGLILKRRSSGRTRSGPEHQRCLLDLSRHRRRIRFFTRDLPPMRRTRCCGRRWRFPPDASDLSGLSGCGYDHP